MEFLRGMDHQNLDPKNLIAALAAVFIALLGLILMLAIFPALALAQDPDCVWENINCTPTPTMTPTGTLTPQPTATIEGIDFEAPRFNVPTSISRMDFPTAPPPLQFTPIPAPSPVSVQLTPIPTSDSNYGLAITPAATVNLVYPTVASINLSAGITGSTELTGAIGSAMSEYGGLVGDMISYTNYLTGEIATMQGTETITVIQAPDWYAPAMPRPMASVGWTFEQLTDPTGDVENFTLSSWAGFFGYVASLPFQFIKTLWQLVAYFGPFGLFLGWLLIMFVIVLAIHAQVFIAKFIIVAVRIISRLAELLGEWIPTGG